MSHREDVGNCIPVCLARHFQRDGKHYAKPHENSPVLLVTILIPQAQERSAPSGMKANKASAADQGHGGPTKEDN